jgi:sugar/nucleoside kinase (ribokinase family)
MGNSILSSAELCICGTLGIDKLEFSDAILDVVGGSSAYANLAASYFGPKVSAITRVGKDFPDEFLSDLVAHRINITNIDIDRQNNSYYWHGRYSRSFNSSTTVCFELNTLTNYLPEIQVSSSEIKYLAILPRLLLLLIYLKDRIRLVIDFCLKKLR